MEWMSRSDVILMAVGAYVAVMEQYDLVAMSSTGSSCVLLRTFPGCPASRPGRVQRRVVDRGAVCGGEREMLHIDQPDTAAERFRMSKLSRCRIP